jgi:hypothetical protein
MPSHIATGVASMAATRVANKALRKIVSSKSALGRKSAGATQLATRVSSPLLPPEDLTLGRLERVRI